MRPELLPVVRRNVVGERHGGIGGDGRATSCGNSRETHPLQRYTSRPLYSTTPDYDWVQPHIMDASVSCTYVDVPWFRLAGSEFLFGCCSHHGLSSSPTLSTYSLPLGSFSCSCLLSSWDGCVDAEGSRSRIASGHLESVQDGIFLFQGLRWVLAFCVQIDHRITQNVGRQRSPELFPVLQQQGQIQEELNKEKVPTAGGS
ncbi:hypothetical protein Taro_005518 [Colocasia esculenta]|uniref:Uncharacterized protein n=1 Tax=Colocasia esculenta TaxID=4460 RepID=A0A843TL52_COLES|nr:hypothetical protein [Colocasia esculenta]